MKNPTDHELKILKICKATECETHNASFYVPCWTINSSTKFGHYPAICNRRALAAGFHGRVDPRSLHLNHRARNFKLKES